MTPDYDSPWKDLLDRFFDDFMNYSIHTDTRSSDMRRKRRCLM
jgi:hypothetical protein